MLTMTTFGATRPTRPTLAMALLAALAFTLPAEAHSSHPATHAATHTATHAASHAHVHHGGAHSGGTKAAPGVARDSHGRIARSEEQKDAFKHSHPCPSTGKSSCACPGYTVDHIVPLKRGGADRPENMQWQTTQAAKAKDRTE